jgi:hypothetical protein
MPLWLNIDQPLPNEIRYPYNPWPWALGNHAIELRRNGELLTPRSPAPVGAAIGGILGGSVAPADSPRSRLPVHVLYPLTQPGRYSVRFTTPGGKLIRTPEVPCESEWLDFVVAPFDERARDDWLAAQASRINSATPGQLVGDILPSLLAHTDRKALHLVLRATMHSDPLVREFARYSLALFDFTTLRNGIPRDLRSVLPPGLVLD